MTTYAEVKAAADRAKSRRAKTMPTLQDCLSQMLQAKERLREFGWNDGMYAPKDGTKFEIIEFGSTGVFDCWYDGEWPEGYWMTSDGRDLYPSSSAPLMFRLKPN